MVFSKKQFNFLYGTIGNSDPRAAPPPPHQFKQPPPKTRGAKVGKKTYLLNGKRYWLCFNVIQQILINKTTNCKHFD